MMSVIRRIGTTSCAIIVSASLSGAASAQAPAAPPTAFDRQLARIDLGISGKGEFTKKTSGNNYLPQTVALVPGNTLGALVTLRYTKSPLVGFEFSYGYARYTEKFSITNLSTTPGGASALNLGVQTNVSEYTVGYVVHAHHDYFGVRPFASVGAGSIAFRPTNGGGQGLLPQARAAYYYSAGAEAQVLNPHFGARATFRQSFFNAPDFESNYFANKQRSISTEPAFGFFVRF